MRSATCEPPRSAVSVPASRASSMSFWSPARCSAWRARCSSPRCFGGIVARSMTSNAQLARSARRGAGAGIDRRDLRRLRRCRRLTDEIALSVIDPVLGEQLERGGALHVLRHGLDAGGACHLANHAHHRLVDAIAGEALDERPVNFQIVHGPPLPLAERAVT